MDYFLFNFSGVQFHYTMSLFKKVMEFNPMDIESIPQDEAHAKAYAEYEIFNKTQKIESDFDKSVKKLLQ